MLKKKKTTSNFIQELRVLAFREAFWKPASGQRVVMAIAMTAFSLAAIQCAKAQIVPDNSLGAESSTVILDNINGLDSDRIEGGATRGANLFHSFESFNVDSGRGVYFFPSGAIENVLTRVTGGNSSNILGTLGVLGNANLFLINPNGIVFGPNARLDLNGSFTGSTADSLVFENDFQFSASNPQAPPLLTINVPIGLGFRDNPGDISNAGSLGANRDLTLAAENLDLSGQLEAGRDLSLEARDTVRVRDTVDQPFIAVAGRDLLIQGNLGVDIFALNHPHSGLFSGGNMVLRSTNPVGGDAHYWSGGSFRIEQLDGNLGDLLSLYDPIIRSLGNVSFDIYLGASLHILAGGSVDIDRAIITSADAIADTINPTATPELANIILSNGTALVIDGNLQPTLDVRAGMSPDAIGSPLGISGNDLASDFFLNLVLSPERDSLATSADITISTISINSPNGLVFLTTQYEPNQSLEGGDIIITGPGGILIDTDNLLGDSGSVILDSRGKITITNSFIQSDAIVFNGGEIIPVGNGGDITLLAKDNIILNSGSSIFTLGSLD